MRPLGRRSRRLRGARCRPGGGQGSRAPVCAMTLPVDDADLVARLGLSVTRLARLLRQQKDLELAPAAASALATIITDGPISLGGLAVAEQVSPSTVTRLVSGLERRGLVERVIGPSDRRVHSVRMTRRAGRAIELYRSKRNAWLTEQLGLDGDGARARLAVTVELLESLAGGAASDPVRMVDDGASAPLTRGGG